MIMLLESENVTGRFSSIPFLLKPFTSEKVLATVRAAFYPGACAA